MQIKQKRQTVSTAFVLSTLYTHRMVKRWIIYFPQSEGFAPICNTKFPPSSGRHASDNIYRKAFHLELPAGYIYFQGYYCELQSRMSFPQHSPGPD